MFRYVRLQMVRALLLSAAVAVSVVSANAGSITYTPLDYSTESIQNFDVGQSYYFTFTVTNTPDYLEISAFDPSGGTLVIYSDLVSDPVAGDSPSEGYTYVPPTGGTKTYVGNGTWDISLILSGSVDPPVGIEIFDLQPTNPLPNPAATPLPAALPLLATGLGTMGLLGWRRKRKNAAAPAAA
jgi:hypothetical protein